MRIYYRNGLDLGLSIFYVRLP